jgi:hypothetical protein
MALNAPSISGQTNLASSNLNPINTQLFVVGTIADPQCFIGYTYDSGLYQLGTINLQANGLLPETSTGLSVTQPNVNRWGIQYVTHFPPFRFEGKNYFVVYDSKSGLLQFDYVSSSSSSSTCDILTNTLNISTNGLPQNLTHIMPVYESNATFLMTYDSSGLSTPNVQFYQIMKDGNGNAGSLTLAGNTTLPRGFTHLMPYVLNGMQRFLAYNANNGVIQFESIPSVGTISTDATTNLGTKWSHFVPVQGATSSSFLMYSSITGIAIEAEISSDNKSITVGNEITGLGTGASLFAPFAYWQANGSASSDPAGGFLAYFPNGVTQVWRWQ